MTVGRVLNGLYWCCFVFIFFIFVFSVSLFPVFLFFFFLSYSLIVIRYHCGFLVVVFIV